MGKILVIGPGAIGLSVGAALTMGGHTVSFFSRQPFDELSVTRRGEVARPMPAHVLTAPDSFEAYDWVILCVKAHQVTGAAEALCSAVGPQTRLAIIQNGVEHIENVTPFIPEGTPCVPVMIDLPTTRLSPGIAEWGPQAMARVPTGEAGEAFCALLAGSFITVTTSDDWLTQAWRKLCINAPAGAVMVLVGQPMAVFHKPGVADIARAILSECIAVGRAAGAHLGDEVLEVQMHSFMTADPAESNSMHQDWLAGRETEWNARNGVIVRKGAQYGVATPVSSVLMPLLAAQNS